MRKLLLLFVVGLIVFLTSACTKNEYTITIDSNYRTTVNEVMAFSMKGLNSMTDYTATMSGDDSIKNQMKEDFETSVNPEIDKLIYEYQSEGYIASKYNQDDYIGVTKTKIYDELANITVPDGFSSNEKSIVEINKGFFKEGFKINWKYVPKNDTDNVLGSALGNSEKYGIDKEMQASMDMMENFGMKPISTLTLKTPYKAKNTNASKKDDKQFVYTWDLDYKTSSDVIIECEKINGINIAFLLTAIFLGIGFIVYKKAEEDGLTGF